MKPNFPDLINFEYFASNEEPSFEGSSIISLQTIEHVSNAVSKRDPLNNRIKSQQLSDVANAIEQYDSTAAKRPVPLDSLHQLYLFAQKAITHIAANPSRKLIKETAYILPNQLKTPRTKTMNWIANQPGRNIREKIAGKRVLAEKNVFVVDTKENKVFYRVMTQLSKEFQNRLAFGVDAGAYDGQPMDEQRIEEMKRFLSIYKKVKYSEVGDLDISKPVIEPNNRLINDKHYAPIWRLYNELNNRKFNIQKNAQFIYQRFEDVAFVYIVLMLNDYAPLQALDLPWHIEDTIERLHVQAYEKKERAGFHYFYEGREQEEEVVRIKAVQLGMKRVVCETLTGEEIIIPASDFPSLAEFGKLRKEQWLSLNSLEVRSQTTSEPFFVRLTMHDYPHKQLTISRLKRVQVSYRVESTSQLRFSIEARDAEMVARRGLPVMLRFEQDGMHKEFATYADMEGLNAIAMYMLKAIATVASFDLTKQELYAETEKDIDKIAMDFTRNVASLYVNNELVRLDTNYLIRYEYASGDERQLVRPNPNYLYEFDKHQVSFFDSLDVENAHYKWNVSYFTLLMQQLRATQHINPVTPFMYMVPDNIDEFAQVDIKKALNICYKKNFPIWRSVAGALTAQQHVPKEQLQRVVVIDTQGPQLSATQLCFVEKNNRGLFMHYPSYEVDSALAKKLTFQHVCETYVKLYNEHYNLALTEQCLQNIVTSGVAERCIKDKQEQLILPEEQAQPIYITFDEQVYAMTTAKWLQVYERFLRKLKTVAKSDATTTAVLILIDFEVDATRLCTIHEAVMQNVPVYPYETAQLLQTVSEQQILQKLLSSEPIWFEYLPDLSLDVIREGTYDSLQLIKDQFIGNTMGAHELFDIQETLILPAGQKSYLFPLKRGGSLGGKINAAIQHPAFPLKTDLEVNLKIEYKYGYENSYRLVLQPLKPHSSIKEMDVQWVQEEKAPSNTQVYGYLDVPDGLMTDEEIELAKNHIDNTLEKALEIKYLFANNNTVRRDLLFVLDKQIFRSVYLIRNLLRQNRQEVHRYLSGMATSEAYQFLLNIKNSISPNILNGNNSKLFIQLFKNTVRFLYSFGEYVPRMHIDEIILASLKNKTYIEHLYALLYRNSDYKPLVQAVDKAIRDRPKNAIRSLRDSMWRDPSILQNLYAQNYKIVECMYGEIKRELKLSAQRKQIDNILYTRDCMEVLLAMLAIRNKPRFEFMQAGSPKALKLAKNIRDVESILYDQKQRTTPTLLQFDLEKPAGLWKLSDIGFVLNAYLTGEVKESLISVRAITEEGDES